MSENDPENIFRAIEKELTCIKFASFGKVKTYTKSKDQKHLEALQREKIKIANDAPINKSLVVEDIEGKMTTVMKKIETRTFEKDMEALEFIKQSKGKSASIFALKDKVIGRKKTQQEQIVIIDPATGEEVYEPEKIKSVSLSYLSNLLKTKEPNDEYADIIARKKALHYERMLEQIPNDLEEMPLESFFKTLENIQKKPGNKYEFITKSGASLKAALLNVFQIIWKYEKVPESWQESIVTQIQKGKIPSNELSNMRHIHSRNQYVKFFSQIVMSHAKENLYKNMSKYQIACKPGHRPSEHLFVLKSVFELYQKSNKGLIL